MDEDIGFQARETLRAGMPADAGVDDFNARPGEKVPKLDAEEFRPGIIRSRVIIDTGDAVAEADNLDGLAALQSLQNTKWMAHVRGAKAG